jgi:hypothetical protein
VTAKASADRAAPRRTISAMFTRGLEFLAPVLEAPPAAAKCLF